MTAAHRLPGVLMRRCRGARAVASFNAAERHGATNESSDGGAEMALSQAAAYIERLQSQKRQTQHGIESLRDHLREHAEREGQPHRFFYEMCGTLLKEMAESECRMDPRK